MKTIDQLSLAISKKLSKDAKLRKLCLDFYNKAGNILIDEGEICEISYDKLFIDEFIPYPPEVVGYVIARFHYMLVNSEAALIAIAVADSPQGNEQIAGNNKILETIAEPFTATFDGTSWGEDGWLEWDASHLLAPSNAVFNKLAYKSYRYPIEVGYCSSLTLWVRMCDWGGWVRWCYNTCFLYLFVASPRFNTSIVSEQIMQEEGRKLDKKLPKPTTFKQLSLFDL